MSKSTDVRVVATRLYFLPIEMRMPLKFGSEITTSVTCARACVTVEGRDGRRAEGWGETPLSVQWVWPGKLPYAERHETLKRFSTALAREIVSPDFAGHAFEIGADWQELLLPHLMWGFNRGPGEPMPLLAGLVCLSVFDIALHDAFGHLHQRPIYSTYTSEFMSRDIDQFFVLTKAAPDALNDLVPGAPRRDSKSLTQAERDELSAWLRDHWTDSLQFKKKYPGDFLVPNPPHQLLAWHLVGGLDPLDESELTGLEPKDGYPVLLRDWIHRDGLKCLKIKLRGNDAEWDFQRLIRVGDIAREEGVPQLTADFNCTVTEPQYVNDILDRLRRDVRDVFDKLLYVEQPFPYELEEFPIDVHSVSQRKPLFLDESAHNWRLVRRGRELGWTGVALKTCKTQTGALLSACWAKAHGMQLMVQDLTNPMLAQIPHVLLAANVGTIAGIETNAMQFYPDASRAEEAVHPGLYRRRNGMVDLSSLHGPGFGYRLKEIQRELPEPAAQFGS
ncbi:MAG TPA: mandelate racemase/muconate lactonizing enzyme family protein [Methylomirabilota bacterium]|nr:mandelate racemase/muconate lactonizing enzyme family protein [Methylomirabilota bacterium]